LATHNDHERGDASQVADASAVLLTAEVIDDQHEEEMDRWVAIDVFHQEIEQRHERKRKRDQEKRKEEATTALFLLQVNPDSAEIRRVIGNFRREEIEVGEREMARQQKQAEVRKREQDEASRRFIESMLANDGVSQDKIASSINDQSKETDRKSRTEAFLAYDGANQSGSATATSTRARRITRPERVAVVQQRVVNDINLVARVREQKAQVNAINAAALESDVVQDDTNPLYCYVCTNVCESDRDMKGFQCRVRRHFVCRKCWAKVNNCPHCGKACGRYL